MVCEANGLVGAAREAYAAATVRRPADAKWWYRLAVVEARMGQPEAAVRSIRKAIDANPGYAPAHWRLGLWLLDATRHRRCRARLHPRRRAQSGRSRRRRGPGAHLPAAPRRSARRRRPRAHAGQEPGRSVRDALAGDCVSPPGTRGRSGVCAGGWPRRRAGLGGPMDRRDAGVPPRLRRAPQGRDAVLPGRTDRTRDCAPRSAAAREARRSGAAQPSGRGATSRPFARRTASGRWNKW